MAIASITPLVRFWLITFTGWATADAPSASTIGTSDLLVTRTLRPARSSSERTGLSRVISTGGALAQIASSFASYSASSVARARNSASVQADALSHTPGRPTTWVIGNTSPV